MSASIISIYNRALLAVAARGSVQSLTENTAESTACNTLFAPTFEALARTAYWNVLKKQVTLTLLEAAAGTPENPLGTTLPLPPQPWLYSYALPSDCLDVRYLIPTFLSTPTGIPLSAAYTLSGAAVGNQVKIPFSVSYDVDSSGNPITVILTNLTQAQLIYTVNQPNPVVWDSLFQAAMVASLAAYLVPALTLNFALMDRCIKQAENAIMQARVADGNEGVSSVNREASWMQARISGGSTAWESVNNNGAFNNMIWPC